jgi:hypothetical protein
MNNIRAACYVTLSEAVKESYNTTHGSPWVVFFFSPCKINTSIFSKENVHKIFSLNKDQILPIECFECDPSDSAFFKPFSSSIANKVKDFICPNFWKSSSDLIITCPLGSISTSVVSGFETICSNKYKTVYHGRDFIVNRIKKLMQNELYGDIGLTH